jgi:hypothetical protein
MNFLDNLPDDVLVMIFSYLSIDDLSTSVRDVCIRWRSLSESAQIWRDLCFIPSSTTTRDQLVTRLQGMPKLRAFEYHGTCDIIGTLSQYCTSLRVLHASRVTINATVLNAAMGGLPELTELGILITLGREGTELTSIIGQSQTLQRLTLYDSRTKIVDEGLLRPIADGCPNLIELAINLEGDINLDEQFCYFLQRKKLQLVAFGQSGRVSRNFFLAINECTNLEKLVFFNTIIGSIPPDHAVTKTVSVSNPELSTFCAGDTPNYIS